MHSSDGVVTRRSFVQLWGFGPFCLFWRGRRWKTLEELRPGAVVGGRYGPNGTIGRKVNKPFKRKGKGQERLPSPNGYRGKGTGDLSEEMASFAWAAGLRKGRWDGLGR